MTRLEVLKMELKAINNLQCLAFAVKEDAQHYYEHEIKCIEEYGAANPEYGNKVRTFYNIDLNADKAE